MEVREALKKAAETLEKSGIETARLDSEVLLAHGLGLSRGELLLGVKEISDPGVWQTFQGFIERRKAREPVARITGVQEFWSLPFKVGEATLIPRPDSETLVEAALKKIPLAKPSRILDLGAGTGCLLLSILSERAKATGLGLDFSEKGLECARENARALGLETRAEFAKCDWMKDALPEGPFDCVVSNPPYIESAAIKTLEPEVAEFGPRPALDGGPDGLDHYRKIVPLAFNRLKPGGWIFLEIGETQEKAVRDILTEIKYTRLETAFDLAGKPRVVAGLKGND